MIFDLQAQITLIKEDETCKDRKDGRIEVQVQGVSSTLQYEWSYDGNPYPGGKIISGLKLGIHSQGYCFDKEWLKGYEKLLKLDRDEKSTWIFQQYLLMSAQVSKYFAIALTFTYHHRDKKKRRTLFLLL